MRVRHPFVQALIVIVLAAVLGVVANGFAGRTRKLSLPGFYPDALRVPPRQAENVAPPAVTGTTATTTATATIAPIVPTMTVPTATVTTTVPVTTTAQTATAATTTTAAATTTAKPAAVTPEAPKVDVAAFKAHPDKAYVELGYNDVKALHDAHALFLDARRSSVFEQGHIAGARSFSVWESDIDEKVNNLFNERSDPTQQNEPIVVYCSGGECEDSHMLAQKLWGIQFNNVYVYKDGFPDWQKHGAAVKTGAQP